jgi:endonuclease-3
MARRAIRPAKERICRIISILRKYYPDSHTALKHHNPFELLIATILSAQCTDERVNKIAPELFKKYKGPGGFIGAKTRELEKDIRSTGFYKNKARNIIGASRKIIKDFGGRVPEDMASLITLPGVARKTANIVLSGSFHKAEGIAVDTHVRRLSEKLGLSNAHVPEKIEQDLMKRVPKKDWLDFNYLLVNHGRKICRARKPLCHECIINSLCPSATMKET